MSRKPTALQLGVLEAVAYGGDGSLAFGANRQVISRARNLCRTYGWLRLMRSGEYRLTPAGRKALAKGGKP